MLVYRLASRRYALDNSEGARIYGGRWNRVGTPVIYASGTISLAALEVIIHNEAIPVDHRVIVIEVPETLQIQSVELQDLSANWPDDSSEVQSAAIGSTWASSLSTAVLRVPSAAIRAEHNYILNPLHPDFGGIRFRVADRELIDKRLRVGG